jgi:predicted nucleic acid-binding protein
MDKLFLDTSFAIALASHRDQHHEQAVTLASEIRANKAQLVTTIPVVIEIGNSLAKQSFRQAAVQLIASLHSDSSVTIVPLDHSLYNRSFSLFADRSDKDWGLTDCISFVVMEDQKIQKALTADNHFQQAGYETLLAN